MADTLREYLIALGFKVDEGSFKKFNSFVTKTASNVATLGAETVAAGLAIGAMVERIARHYEELYYISQRTDASVSTLKSYGLAAKQVGLTVEQMLAAQEQFSAAQRMNPGIAGLVKGFSSATDKGEQLVDVVAGLKKQFGEPGYYAAARVAGLMGLDEPTFRMLWMNLERFKESQALQKKLMKEAGIDADAAAQKFTDFAREMNVFTERWSILGQRIALDFLPYVTEAVKGLNELLAAFTRFNAEDTEGRAGMVAAIATGGLGAYLAKKLAGRLLFGAGASAAGAATGAGAGAAGAGAGTGAGIAGGSALAVGSAVALTAGVFLAASTRTANKGEKDLYTFNPVSGQYEPTDELRRQQGLPPAGGTPGPGQATALSPADRDMLIRTVIGEAANQSEEGKAAVAAVVLNRLKSGRYGKNVTEIVLAPKQFEPWATRGAELMTIPAEDRRYKSAAAVVDEILAGKRRDPTQGPDGRGATHFQNPDIVAGRGNASGMAWLEDMKRNRSAIRIGDHVFGSPDSKPGATAPTPATPFIGRSQADLMPGLGAGTAVNFNQTTEIKVEQGPTATATAQGVLAGQERVNGDAVRNLGAKVR